MAFWIAAAVCFLAFANGANDNFKGVATLFGSGTAGYRITLAWATLTTAAGCLLALWLARGLVEAFKGKGLVPAAVAAEPRFLLAVSLGAAATVLLATRFGFPVSTTHSLIGGLVGAGWLASGGQVAFRALGTAFLLPLLLSPLLALLLTLSLYPLVSRARRALGVTRESCLCVGVETSVVALAPGGAASAAPVLSVTQGQRTACAERYQGRLLGLDAGRLLDAVHFASAGTVGFARGLNDAPKIVALLIAAEALSPSLGLLAVAAVMALGGLLSARRVAETLSRRITTMNAGQGATANLVTSLLVLLASRYSLPVSTTHVSVGALFGIGTVTGTARRDVVVAILLAWVTTLPLACLLAATAYRLLPPG
mgnify:CR=1 FL=1